MSDEGMENLLATSSAVVDEDDEDGETMTAAEVLSKLEEAWLNEKFSPDLLPAKENLVECMMAQIDAMENNITNAKKGDFRISVHRMEIDRIRYIVSSYLRHRLSKIETFAKHVLSKEAQRGETDEPLLSDAELQFAKGYQTSIDEYLKNQAIKHLPSRLAKLNEKQTTVLPNLDSYVFFKVNETAENVLVEEETVDAGDEIMDLEKGDQHIMRYKVIAPLLEAGTLSLI